MFEDDYVMRQVAGLSRILARILGFRQAEQHVEALAAAEEGLNMLLGMGSELAASWSAAALVDLVTEGIPAPARAGRIELLARLLEAAAESHAFLHHDPAAQLCRTRAQEVRMAVAARDGSNPPPA